MTKATTCPECGAAATGNFCASCGTPLGSRFCTQCGAKGTGGARFCTQCGASMAGGPSGKVRAPAASATTPGGGGASGSDGGANMGWWIAGAMMVVVIVFMAWPILNPSPPAATGVPAAAGGGGATTDIANMTPRQAADRLFTRVMTAAEMNDSAQVTTFLPMAIQSYEMARPLDPDGLYHLSRLQRVGAMNPEALDTAREALEVNPDYLLALYAAGDAAMAMGDDAGVREYFGRLLAAWDGEMASGNQDYQLHSAQMDQIRETAESVVTGG